MSGKRFECEYEGCDKFYCSSFNLKRHVEIVHLGLRRFKCTVCARSLSSRQNLIDHQNIHTGSKPYVCEVSGCRHPFRQLSQYFIHRQMHSEVNSHFCESDLISKSILDYLAKKITLDSYITSKITVLGESTSETLPKINNFGQIAKLPHFKTLKIEKISDLTIEF